MSPHERLQKLYERIDNELGVEDAVHAANAIISLDEPMRLLTGLQKDTDLEVVANGLFQPFDNGHHPGRGSHLFIADTNHFALPLLLAAQAREGNEARDNAMLMPMHTPPYGGKVHVQDTKILVRSILGRLRESFTGPMTELSSFDTLYPGGLCFALRALELAPDSDILDLCFGHELRTLVEDLATAISVLDRGGQLFHDFALFLTCLKLGLPSSPSLGPFQSKLIWNIVTTPSAGAASIHTLLALLPLEKDVIDLSDEALEGARTAIMRGVVGPEILTRQFEEHRYRPLTSDEGELFASFMPESFGSHAWETLADHLPLAASEALDKKDKARLQQDMDRWKEEGGEGKFFQSQPHWLIPILRHPSAHGDTKVEHVVGKAIDSPYYSHREKQALTQIATAFARARPRRLPPMKLKSS